MGIRRFFPPTEHEDEAIMILWRHPFAFTPLLFSPDYILMLFSLCFARFPHAWLNALFTTANALTTDCLS